MLTESLDGGHVIYRSTGSTNFASLYKNRRHTYWKTAEFITRRLSDLHRRGWRFLEGLETYRESAPYTRGIYRRPTNGQMLRFLSRTAAFRLRKKIEDALEQQWVVAVRRRGDPSRYTIAEPPRGRFFAEAGE